MCNAFDNSCNGTISGSFADPNQGGSYTLQFTLDGISDFSGPLGCFTPTLGGTNQAILDFTSPGKTGQLTVTTGSICLPTDPSIESGTFTIAYTILSGTGDFATQTGDGALIAPYVGSLMGPVGLFTTLPPDICLIDPNGCNGNPGGGATPELDSLVLFGTGLSGVVVYAIRRRRAGKLIK
jgi:hypothetical protein